MTGLRDECTVTQMSKDIQRTGVFIRVRSKEIGLTDKLMELLVEINSEV